MWLKIKVWTKVTVFALLFLYVLIFTLKNTDDVTPWPWFNTEPQMALYVLLVVTFLLGILAAILFRTTIKTLRQIRELKQRSRSERLEREVSDMKTKAAMLRSRPESTTPDATAP